MGQNYHVASHALCSISVTSKINKLNSTLNFDAWDRKRKLFRCNIEWNPIPRVLKWNLKEKLPQLPFGLTSFPVIASHSRLKVFIWRTFESMTLIINQPSFCQLKLVMKNVCCCALCRNKVYQLDPSYFFSPECFAIVLLSQIFWQVFNMKFNFFGLI